MRIWKQMLPLAIGAAATLLMLSAAFGADWPTWRYDAGRTGATPVDIPNQIHLQWHREFPPVVPAWPYEQRMQFDPCYEPIVMGKTLFVGSPNDGSVRAYDTETGEQKWRFYTDGPVRFAPVVWPGKLYVASDDGRVYCLDAETGSLKWKFRAAPQDRPDLGHLGNNRLVSYWPVRGGPLIVDGTLYFASGIWATMGTFVYAIEAESGKVIWANDRLNYMTNIRIDHNRIADSALCPQGYLVFESGKLLVPNGRGMPVGLDPKTGKLLYYVQGYRHGHCRVTAKGKYVFVGRQAVLDINTGREVGERWHEGHPETPKEYSRRYDLFEGPFVPYKFMRACDGWSVLDSGTVYGGHHGTFHAYDVGNARKTTYSKRMKDQDLDPGKWEAPLLWKLSTKHSQGELPSDTIIRAGRRLYGHAGQGRIAVDLPAEGGEPKIAWEKRIPGVPATMLAADEKLFVVTREGHILCFGSKEVEPKTYARPNRHLPDVSDKWERQAAEILKTTSETAGYCVVLGIESGRLVEELLRQSQLKVIAVDNDRERVDALRDRLVEADIYGSRAEVLVGDPATFGFPSYLASLVVSEAHDGPSIAAKMKAEGLVRILHPYGGTACLRASDSQHGAMKAWTSGANLENAGLSFVGDLALLRRDGALPGSAHWTHECADAARTYFSKDKLVKAPLGVLWYGDGPDHGFKKRKDYHHGVKPQVVNGRLIAFNDSTKVLQAYDVYTGRVLWKHDVDEFTRFASLTDGVYVAGGNTCVVYDPATGEKLKTFPYHAGESKDELFVADIRVGEDVAVVAVDFAKVRRIAEGLFDSKRLVGLDRKTGKQLWTRMAQDRFNHHGLAIGGGLVFCVDSPSNKKTGEMKRRGNPPKTLNSTVLALQPRTGSVKWHKVFENPFVHYGDEFGPVQSNDDALFYSEQCDVLVVYKDRRYRAINGADGETLWEKQGAAQPIIVAGEKYYEQGGAAFDMRTGERVPSNARVLGGNGCNHAVANEHLFFRRRFTAAYFDIRTGAAHYMRSARSGCTNSLIPADGVLSSPCFSVRCVCNHPLETSFCLVHLPVAESWEGTEAVCEPLPLGQRDPAKWRKEPQ